MTDWNKYIGKEVEVSWRMPVITPEHRWRRRILVAYLEGAAMPFVCAAVPKHGLPLKKGYAYSGFDYCREIENA